MSDHTLEERLLEIADWITEGGEGGVREPDPDELRSIADKVGALERERRVMTGMTIEAAGAGIVESQEATIAKLEGELRHEQNANEALWDALTARIKKLEKALKATTEALGDHYCGVCFNAGDGLHQPYHAATEAETCDGCRGNWKAWRAGKDLLDE